MASRDGLEEVEGNNLRRARGVNACGVIAKSLARRARRIVLKTRVKRIGNA
jgi:hypothetical protein